MFATHQQTLSVQPQHLAQQHVVDVHIIDRPKKPRHLTHIPLLGIGHRGGGGCQARFEGQFVFSDTDARVLDFKQDEGPIVITDAIPDIYQR